jgi:predicted phosphodiesterase
VRVAALYDIHGNLPALEAVLAEAEADLFVVGGDVGPGPMVGEVLDRLAGLPAVRYVMGNGDRELLDPEGGGNAPAELTRWCAERLTPAQRERLAAFEPTVSAAGALFCHGSPRSDTEIITALSPEPRLAPMLERVAEALVVCGHTHHQFDRAVLGKRLVNAGSVGMPYEDEPAAYWLDLRDGEPELRRTDYDVGAAVARLRAAGFPGLEEVMFEGSLVNPVGGAFIARHFEDAATA